jgi:hypothetical protein
LVARLNWVTGVMRRNVYSVLQTGHAAGDHALLSLAAEELIPVRAWLGMNSWQQGLRSPIPA